LFSKMFSFFFIWYKVLTSVWLLGD
jgi:hypothetical protein